MLQLHLDRIEHEHSNVTLWGAVLTILFIVFAMIFSLNKTVKSIIPFINEKINSFFVLEKVSVTHNRS